MNEAEILDLTAHGMLLVLLLSMPAILLATIAGLGISLLQAITQIQEQTLGFAVKLIVIVLTMLFTANFMVAELFNYTQYLFNSISTQGR